MSQKAAPILTVLLVIAAFAIGSMWTRIQYLQQTPLRQDSAGQAPQPAAPTAAPTVKIDQIKALFADGYIRFGEANKKILFVEISDPSCPYCHYAGGKNPELSKTSGRFQYVTDGGTYNPPVPEMRKLVDAGKASFAWIYSNGHGNGELGAQAFYCANEKGKFWGVHDLIMSNKGYDLLNNTAKNDKVNSGALADFLAPAIDQIFMKTCLESKKYAEKITRDQQISPSLGFGGTPTFLINTTIFGGAVDFKNAMEPVVTPLL